VYRSSRFGRLAKQTSRLAGHPASFVVAALVVISWAVLGPVFQFSDTWQLVINTGTTIATFLMVFLVQNTQNRDSAAMQLKLDELIRAVEGAHNVLLDLEELDQQTLESIRAHYLELARQAREDREHPDTGSPDVSPFPS
jgi:low affinity Fe/Cu permease